MLSVISKSGLFLVFQLSQNRFLLRVVTGVRFTKQNRIIHIQIQEGTLLPRGAIDPSTVQWKPVSDYTIFDRLIRNGHDYHTLKWDNRSIDLDDLVAKPSHVLTGEILKLKGGSFIYVSYCSRSEIPSDWNPFESGNPCQ